MRNTKELVKLAETHGVPKVVEVVEEAGLRMSEFSIQDLAYEIFGKRVLRLNEGRLNRFLALREAGEVKTTMFSNITGQLLFSEVRGQFMHEDFVFSREVRTVSSRIRGTETVPSIATLGDTAATVGEGEEYPSVGLLEEYFTIPAGRKRGHKIEVTEEAVFFDLTSMLVDAARKVGYNLGFSKEKEVIDILTGNVNNYSRNGTATNTWLTAGAYINLLQGTAALLDWTDIEEAENLFVDILDPNTGEPLADEAGSRVLIVMPQLEHTARQIVGATELRSTRGTNIETISGNSVAPYRIIRSRQLYRRTLATVEAVTATAAAGWWIGSLAEAIAWKEIWPLAMFEQDGSHSPGFDRDVALRFKARFYGRAYSREPRKMVKVEPVAW